MCIRCVHSFEDSTTTYSARFNGEGSRLLCSPYSNLPVIYNVPTEQQQQQKPAPADSVTGMVELTAPGYSVAKSEHSSNCFAGDDDELVVASSSDHRLFIWSVPDGRGDRTIDQSLLSLTGHQHEIHAVRYCKSTSTLASGDNAGVIKLWTSSSTGRH